MNFITKLFACQHKNLHDDYCDDCERIVVS